MCRGHRGPSAGNSHLGETFHLGIPVALDNRSQSPGQRASLDLVSCSEELGWGCQQIRRHFVSSWPLLGPDEPSRREPLSALSPDANPAAGETGFVMWSECVSWSSCRTMTSLEAPAIQSSHGTASPQSSAVLELRDAPLASSSRPPCPISRGVLRRPRQGSGDFAECRSVRQ